MNLDVQSLLYANDFYVTEAEEECSKIQNNLNKINHWCLLNHVTKCSYLNSVDLEIMLLLIII